MLIIVNNLKFRLVHLPYSYDLHSKVSRYGALPPIHWGCDPFGTFPAAQQLRRGIHDPLNGSTPVESRRVKELTRFKQEQKRANRSEPG